MSRDQELAHSPGNIDPSRHRRPLRSRLRLAPRGIGALLVVLASCSRAAPTEAPRGPVTTQARSPATSGLPTHAAATPVTPAAEPPRDEKSPGVHERLESIAEVEAAAAVAPGKPAEKRGTTGGGALTLGLSGAAVVGGGAALGASGIGHGSGRGMAAPKMRMAAAGRLGGMRTLARPAATASAGPMAPGTELNTEGYRGIHDNPFRLVAEAPLSTFSVDVDTASYSNMRRFVSEGRMPPADAIRVEEWVNYFGYSDAPPSGDEPVAVSSELTECPWAKGHELLRVALTTPPIAQGAVPPRNLVFLVDVSGSMQDERKLPLLQRGLALLARQLRPVDTLSIVVYAGASGVALPPTSGANQGKILETLESLQAGGSTNGAEGIQLAYQLASRQMKRGGINRVILATDGDFNVGVTSEGELERLIEQERKSGVFLTVLGFGEGNLQDSKMETLADKGNGNYAYIDSLAEARKVLVHEAGATLVTVAKDVKLQLEFNPKRVASYRLVGYENRVLADQDFNDDAKDAGEMGAGHHVTAFYELVPAGAAPSPLAAPRVDPLRYQTERAPSAAATTAELVTVKIRYKAPDGQTSLLLSRPVLDRLVPLSQTSDSLRFGAAVAEYALSLRGAPGLGVQHLASARSLATSAIGPDPTGERREFIALMDRAATLPK